MAVSSVARWALASLLAVPLVQGLATEIVVNGTYYSVNSSTLAPAGALVDGEVQLTDAIVTNLTDIGLSNAELFEFDTSSSNLSKKFRSCKVYPSDAVWIATLTWDMFDILAGGTLISTVPLEAPCYADWPHHENTAECLYITDNWTNSSIDAPDPASIIYYTGKAVKMGAAVGGKGRTVGVAGGYVARGEHSPLSSIYGMAADQVLELEVVTPDRRFVTASATENADLYWALRGGGAGVRTYFDHFIEHAERGIYSYFAILATGTDAWSFALQPLFAPNYTAAELETLVAPCLDKHLLARYYGRFWAADADNAAIALAPGILTYNWIQLWRNVPPDGGAYMSEADMLEPNFQQAFYGTNHDRLNMLLIGLTGSIATGKSTVSSILSQAPYSLPIIDADLLARKVVEPGTPGYDKIVAHFSPTTPDLLLPPSPDHDNTKGAPLNRPALGRRVFGDSEERKRDRAVLNGIVHPAVRKEMYKQLLGCYLKGCWAVVLDVPLLFESGIDVICGTVLVVAVRDPKIQMQRLRDRDSHLTEEDAENRVKSQGDVREKAKRCQARGEGYGLVVWNDEGKDELRTELQKVMESIQGKSPRWWAWLLLLCPPLAGLAGVWNYWRNLTINKEWKRGELQAKAKL
ncbi:hypothetical protein BPOR_0548g00030 [Botrytis porri]|uniref:FAD-binding PCMH-type domain-containing protein n=2 Tax=Botrytis porri TaxID=87229 RepID=A0A4Z1KF52_9HELO|nr:hypothetical protein BPOR_0548g00030 [Botrytis porri]